MSAKNILNKPSEEKLPWYYYLYNTIKDTPINMTMLFVSAFVFYKVLKINRRRNEQSKTFYNCQKDENAIERSPSPLTRDLTVMELREYNGSQPDGRILIAINFNIYDVSKAKHYYGQGGTYPQYAGRDISRSLIHFSAEHNDCEDFDDLSDLTKEQMSTLVEWDQQYSEKYPFVGRLVSDTVTQEPNSDEIRRKEAEPNM